MNRIGSAVLGGALLGAGIALLWTAYNRSERNARAVWADLARAGEVEPFRVEMVDGLPDPARRMLLRAIAPGTPLVRGGAGRRAAQRRLRDSVSDPGRLAPRAGG